MRVCLLLFFAAVAWGQGIEVGVEAGVPLTTLVQERPLPRAPEPPLSVNSKARRFLAGPVVAVGLGGFGIEGAAIHRRFGYDSHFSAVRSVLSTEETRATGSGWEFPVLLTKRLPAGRLSVVLSAGGALRHLSGIEHRYRRTEWERARPDIRRVTEAETDRPLELSRRTHVGAAFRVGVEWRVGQMRFSPGLRWTWWDSPRAGEASSIRLVRTTWDFGLQIRRVL